MRLEKGEMLFQSKRDFASFNLLIAQIGNEIAQIKRLEAEDVQRRKNIGDLLGMALVE
jgi:hypothetical protein